MTWLNNFCKGCAIMVFPRKPTKIRKASRLKKPSPGISKSTNLASSRWENPSIRVKAQ